MKVEILYCEVWGYKPRAASLAAKIKKELGLEVEIRPGPRSQFTVNAGSTLVAKKDASGFPAEEAVVLALRKLAQPSNP